MNRQDVRRLTVEALSAQSCATCDRLGPCVKRKDHWGTRCKDFIPSERFANERDKYTLEAVLESLDG